MQQILVSIFVANKPQHIQRSSSSQEQQVTARQDIFFRGPDRRLMLSIPCVELIQCERQTACVVITDPNQRVEIERCDRRALYNGRYATDNNVLDLVFVKELEYLAKAGIHCATAMIGRNRFLTPVRQVAVRALAWRTTQPTSGLARNWMPIGRVLCASNNCITWRMARTGGGHGDILLFTKK